MSNSAKCEVCGSSEGNMRTYGVAVDGFSLVLQPVLCMDHGERFILRAGILLGCLDKTLEQVFAPGLLK